MTHLSLSLYHVQPPTPSKCHELSWIVMNCPLKPLQAVVSWLKFYGKNLKKPHLFGSTVPSCRIRWAPEVRSPVCFELLDPIAGTFPSHHLHLVILGFLWNTGNGRNHGINHDKPWFSGFRNHPHCGAIFMAIRFFCLQLSGAKPSEPPQWINHGIPWDSIDKPCAIWGGTCQSHVNGPDFILSQEHQPPKRRRHRAWCPFACSILLHMGSWIGSTIRRMETHTCEVMKDGLFSWMQSLITSW